MARRQKRPSLELEQFRYPDELRLALPQLVLGMLIPAHKLGSDYPPRDPVFVPGRTWLKVIHDTAGLGHNQVHLVCTPLTARNPDAIRTLVSRWEGTNVGMAEPTLTTLNVYADELKRTLKVACNESHHLLAEGLYPMDPHFLPDVATDAIDPAKLDDLIEWDSGAQRAEGCVGRWSLVILGGSRASGNA